MKGRPDLAETMLRVPLWRGLEWYLEELANHGIPGTSKAEVARFFIIDGIHRHATPGMLARIKDALRFKRQPHARAGL